MKNVVRALIFISISLVAVNCSNDESLPVQGRVQFALAITGSSADGGRILSQSFPSGSSISLSIETASGASVHSLKKVDLIKLGDGYITAPLALTEGSYRLTDFFVMSASNEVLYATPKAGSPLAELVEHPLPMNFSITVDGIANLNIQVVDADQQTPVNFGYASFAAEIVESDFSVSVFIGDNNALRFTSGILRLYRGNDLVHTQNLQAKVNPIKFKGDPSATYTVTVEKQGYTLKSKEYVLHDLVDELDGRPLVILLLPASTFTVMVNIPSEVGLQLTTLSDNLYVDWGDGTVERATTTGYFAKHRYPELGRYCVNITGDLASITEYEFTWIDYEIGTWQTIETVDITQLSELKKFSLFWRRTPKEINLSQNLKLEYLDISFTSVPHVDISNNHYLKHLNYEGAPYPIPDDESDIAKFMRTIELLNQHAVENNLRDGLFGYTGRIARSVPDEGKAILINLKENYGWEVWPSPN